MEKDSVSRAKLCCRCNFMLEKNFGPWDASSSVLFFKRSVSGTKIIRLIARVVVIKATTRGVHGEPISMSLDEMSGPMRFPLRLAKAMKRKAEALKKN